MLSTSRYETARKIKVEQDRYCAKALRGEWKGLGEFPENLQWEALVDVLRGRVKVLLIRCFQTDVTKFTITRFIIIVMRLLTLME